jgi:hypothetical protein
MKVIEANFKEWQPAQKKQYASLLDNPINEDCVLIDKEHQTIVAAQIKIDEAFEETCAQISRLIRHDVSFGIDSARLSGIKSANRVFGTLEPNKLRRRFGCTNATLNRENPELVFHLGLIAKQATEMFRTIDAHRAAEHDEIVRSQIHSDWLINDTPFTSGVINQSSALPYHRDSGNLNGSWSAMLSIRKNMNGGHLHLPEYDVTLGIPDRSITLFNGQSLWHGVTPMMAAKKDAYRFTIVWYAKSKICNCVAAQQEAQRAAEEASKHK